MAKAPKYYRVPLNIASFIQEKNVDSQVEDGNYVEKEWSEKISLEESIKMNLQLILRTKLKTCRFDPEFGYLGWSKDFENITADENWDKDVKDDFKQRIIEYERRLVDLRVNIEFKKNNSKASLLNHQFTVRVEAKLKFTAEPFSFEEKMYFSPIRISIKS